jgi:hypothetical protein
VPSQILSARRSCRDSIQDYTVPKNERALQTFEGMRMRLNRQGCMNRDVRAKEGV